MREHFECVKCEKKFTIMVFTESYKWWCLGCYGMLDKAFVLIEAGKIALIIEGETVETAPALDRQDFEFEGDYLDSQTEALRDLAAEYGYRESKDLLYNTEDSVPDGWRGSVLYESSYEKLFDPYES